MDTEHKLHYCRYVLSLAALQCVRVVVVIAHQLARDHGHWSQMYLQMFGLLQDNSSQVVDSSISLCNTCNTCITSHFNYATLFTYSSHMYILHSIPSTVSCHMPLCTITHSYILMYIFFIPLHCVQDSSFGIVS